MNADGARPTDAPDVVAPEVEKHDVLGDLFFVGEEFCGERFVLFRCPTAGPRAGDRVYGYFAVYRFDQQLGRRADDLEAIEIEVEHVRRRIDGS